MGSGLLHIGKLIFRLLPETRCFSFKASLLRWAGAKVGRNVRVCSSVTILGRGILEIGDDTWIGHQVFIASSSSVRIGNCVNIAPRVFVGTGTHQLDPKGKSSAGLGINRDVVISDGVWLCACATILPGISIGDKAVVAAGAMVNKDVSERQIVGGVPAKVLQELS